MVASVLIEGETTPNYITISHYATSLQHCSVYEPAPPPLMVEDLADIETLIA